MLNNKIVWGKPLLTDVLYVFLTSAKVPFSKIFKFYTNSADMKKQEQNILPEGLSFKMLVWCSLSVHITNQ